MFLNERSAVIWNLCHNMYENITPDPSANMALFGLVFEKSSSAPYVEDTESSS